MNKNKKKIKKIISKKKNVNKIENDKNKNENDTGGDIDEIIEVIE